MFLSVIIPAYNEEKRIASTLTAVRAFLAIQQYPSEIIVVNDGSTDATKAIIDRHASKNITVITIPTNRGKGFAVREGMLAAHGTYRLFMDADSSTSISQIHALMSCLSGGFDIAVSSRRAKGAVLHKAQPFIRRNLGRLFGILVECIVPLGIQDTQNGFKMFTAEAAKEIFSRQRIHGWAFDVEILAIGKELNFKTKEIPIEWVNHTDSRVNLLGMINSLLDILKIRFNLLVNRYQSHRVQSEAI